MRNLYPHDPWNSGQVSCLVKNSIAPAPEAYIHSRTLSPPRRMSTSRSQNQGEKHMRQITLNLSFCLAVLSSTPPIAHQRNPQPSAPVIQINVSRNIQTVNYWARGSTKMNFIGTALLPRAEGRATVQSTGGALAIEAEFNGLAPVSTFGPEYLTYVLWAITPEGLANNLGEVQVRDGKSNVKASTKLQTFGMIVTAETYFAVTFPSDEVVM